MSDTTLITYITLTLLVFYSIATRVAPYDGAPMTECRLGYVYDGDTVEMLCGAEKLTARLVGFDTPETKDPGCQAELDHGKSATQRLRALVKGAEISFFRQGHDRYGRELVVLKADGEDVAKTLISEGLAVEYSGGKRIDWCERLGA